jgi:DNA-binding YbaB/EbfC family protein
MEKFMVFVKLPRSASAKVKEVSVLKLSCSMNINQLVKQAQQMQGKMQQQMEQLEKSLALVEHEGRSGSGLVRVMATGQGVILSVVIDPSLMIPGEHAILEDLLVAALHDVHGKVEHYRQAEMSKITSGLNVPGMKLPF